MVDGCGRFQYAALAGWLLIGAASSEAQPRIRQVLMLQSFDRGSLVLDSFAGNFRVDLEEATRTPVNVVQVVVGPTGFVVAPEREVVDYIRATFANRANPDLIVSLGGPAAAFARKHRRQIFPETPLLLASVDQQYLRDAPLGANETAVAVFNDFPQLINEILDLLPETRQVFMVLGSGQLGSFWRRVLEEQFRPFRGRLTFLWSNDLSLQEILRRCANLPSGSAILFVSLITDSQGGAYADERALAGLHATANAPLFARHSVLLGRGVVGGRLMSIEDLSHTTADAAIRLLNGAPPRSINVPPLGPGQPIFDWRELQRWGIAESRLPAGSVVRYRGPSLWEAHRTTVLVATGTLVIQALLIVGLLYQHRARRRAELDSRRNLALAADASRRQTMSALTSSISHELGQPLNSMIHNAQALQMMMEANRATPDTIGEILTDIQTQGVQATQIIERHRAMLRSHQLDKKAVDLQAAINESLALVAHDLKARQVGSTVEVSSLPCVVIGDQVLLQQVLVNLIVNAMDAMAEAPPDRRHITITSEVRDTKVEIAVRDTGMGLPPELDGKLFAPFVTTKSQGLGIGLTIARNIIDAHGGTIDAGNNPEGGATFTVTLALSEASRG